MIETKNNVQKDNASEALPRILIVDDNSDLLAALEDILIIDNQYTVASAPDITSALQIVEDVEPDIALIDIRLGTTSGLDLISMIKGKSQDTDCIMMTAHREVDEVIQALRQGAAEYLLKPIDSKMLLKVIDNIVQQRRIKNDKHNNEQRFKRLALRDPLTGLANRTLLYEHLEKTLARAKRNHQNFPVIFIDLDDFKQINDSLGHQAGDGLLINISQCLTTCVREEDTVARIGGDEFVIVLNSQSNDKGIRNSIERVMQGITETVAKSGFEDIVSASIGIAIFPTDGSSADSLLGHADAAMYKAKKQGKNCFQYYSE